MCKNVDVAKKKKKSKNDSIVQTHRRDSLKEKYEICKLEKCLYERYCQNLPLCGTSIE